ncbi:RDD family protein [Phytohabitans rumicis]|uniref:RDD family protein n=1 Tax=Phytohabitans rumicis TaxID=1076125 RepID=UPI001FEB8003|nr:RDD family protein [Phytohabitans rumicis]
MNAQVPGVVSGEAVELEIRAARVGSRVLALLIDIAVQVLIALVLLFVTVMTLSMVPAVDPALEGALFTVGTVLVLVGYPVLCETFSRGRTVGKLAVGLRVVRDDGGPVLFRHALTRGLVGVAVEWPGLVLPLVTWVASIATMLGNPRSKRLGDLAAGTMVIHERTPASWGWVPGMPLPLATWAATLDLTGLDDDLALAVRHFLARGHGLAEPERSRLGRALAAEVAATTTPPPPPGVPGWAYLAAVLAERHRRAAHRLARARSVTATLWPGLVSPRRGVPTQLRPPAPARPGEPQNWPTEAWPDPPWQTPSLDPVDWTGLRPPPVASALRRSAPD